MENKKVFKIDYDYHPNEVVDEIKHALKDFNINIIYNDNKDEYEILYDWKYTDKNEFPKLYQKIITINNEIGHFTANYKFINEVTNEVSIDEIIWRYL